MKPVCLWTDQAPPSPDLGKDPLPRKTDVAIIGGGYTGLWTARQLAKLGAKPVVVERQTLCWGASSRNGGKALVGLKPPPQVLFRKYGPELGRVLWQASVDGIFSVETLVNEEKIDCDFVRCGSFFAACKPAHYEAMCRETEWLKRELHYERHNVSRAEQRGEIGTDVYHGGVVDPPSAGLHPAKYVFGLARAAARAGATLCSLTEVLGIKRRNGTFELATSSGPLEAKEVVIATNGYTNGLVPAVRRLVIAIGSYIIATEPLPPAVQQEISPRGRMFYDSKWFLNYFGLTPDGRMLFGGRTSLSPGQDLEMSARILRKAMVQMFPILRDVAVTHSWSGHLGLTFDTLPHIGRVDGVHYALGYSGHGVAVSAIVGAHVAELLAGQRTTSPFLEVQHPTHFFYRGRAWFRPFLAAGLRIMDWIT